MALLQWIRQNLQERQKLFPGLLSLTRLHHLPAPALKVQVGCIHLIYNLLKVFFLQCYSTSLHQTLQESDTLLSDDESCLALLSEARSRQIEYDGLLTDARPATTQSYIYIHKTEENGEIRHTFCYCLETDQWKELGTGHGEEAATIPDPPGSYLTSYAEKVHYGRQTGC